jgi:hypothetical protein
MTRESSPGSGNPVGRYLLYGVTLEASFPFSNRLPPSTGDPDVVISVSPRSPAAPPLPGFRHLADHPRKVKDEPFSRLFAFDGGYVLAFTATADFVLRADTIHCYVDDDVPDHLRDVLVELRLLGPVMAFWLEVRGTLALHASAVVIDDAAVGFLSHGKGGKTSVAATLVQQGHPMLTDDLLPVTVTGGLVTSHGGFGNMRMWPPEAEHFLGTASGLPLVHPFYEKRRVPVGGSDGWGSFDPRPRDLRCLYVLERAPMSGPRLQITEVPPREAFTHLMRHSTAPFLTSAGVAPGRLQRLAQLLRTVPVRHVLHATPHEGLASLARSLVAQGSKPEEMVG